MMADPASLANIGLIYLVLASLDARSPEPHRVLCALCALNGVLWIAVALVKVLQHG